MLNIDIPSFANIKLSHLVLDYNGTLALDGKLIAQVTQLIKETSKNLTIHVVTGDTFSTAKSELKDLPINLVIAPKDNQAKFKLNYIEALDPLSVASIGNGCNDSLMLKYCALGICVLQKEGACVKALIDSDIVVENIVDAFEILLNPRRLIATLRG